MAQASAWYRCGHDGQTRSACCCPPKANHHKAPASDKEITPACCCKVTHLKAQPASVRAAPPAALDVAPALISVAISIAPIGAPIRYAMVEHTYAPRGPPQPLFVRHCSLLL